MKTTTTVVVLLSALISTTLATPLTPLQSRYTHIQLVQRASSSNSTAPSTTAVGSTLTIQEGDTLSSIAAAAGVGICDLAKTNNIKDLNVIEAGATLKIPAKTGKKDDTSCMKMA
ncbi:carbohydrate-binding module family 50 protein [Macroventuria anomochaeta]|uniref:Carbohydrate-binding module family 50 protein n=1 Tax=Macroventuria anomochaeta TaxID=301207 RepID=A0ACB6S1Y6_9PLEO|nr:carbohydrate-binding module family 50 protein [Macroventuria anomochaeta]KAF2628245.1 carbohydrate-binding module family 50 protein [Macroventuria anomochaeta]